MMRVYSYTACKSPLWQYEYVPIAFFARSSTVAWPDRVGTGLDSSPNS